MRVAVLSFSLAITLVACGGGQDPSPDAAAEAKFGQLIVAGPAKASADLGAADAPLRKALTSTSINPSALTAAAATQLFDFAERSFPAYFPSAQPSRTVDTWFYRYYPQTQIYLAVIAGRVYVMGGSFGPEVVSVGLLTDYVTPATTPVGTAITAAQLARCPQAISSTAANFYTCMTGSLTGTQKFDATKSCKLTVGSDGSLTLSSGAASYSVAPPFVTVSYTNQVAIDVFSVHAISTLQNNDLRSLAIISGPSNAFRFSTGGVIDAEVTHVVDRASLSCTFNVAKG